MAGLNGHDRVVRYRDLDHESFKVLVGDDVNGLIEAVNNVASKLDAISLRISGAIVALVLLLIGVIVDLVVK